MKAQECLNYLWITLGTCLIAVAFHLLIEPNNLLVSGTGGIALLIVHFFPVSLGLVYFVLNTPLFLIGWRFVGTRFLLKSIWGTVSLSLFLSLFAFLPGIPYPILGAILGGILSGIGIGIGISAGGTTGGTDILSVVIHQKFKWSIGKVMFWINCAIVIVGTYLFGWEKAILTVLSLYATTWMVNIILKKYPPSQAKEHLQL
ncbi:YitT family protein [Shimazuella sp. AN120528]|uniref:YitT family protein n=1 Tax=Shimazuella soli TaxID=1892854 RepID=UPI001F0E9C4E|nr:YitT family protein [Shimazuella soli]MCH5586514.1 YitT family protein [Shimazuella soli]